MNPPPPPPPAASALASASASASQPMRAKSFSSSSSSIINNNNNNNNNDNNNFESLSEASSGTSSPVSKRKRSLADTGDDDTRRCPSRKSNNSDFSVHTKDEIRERYGNKCWHCGASPVDICHVIGSRDSIFKVALEENLIDIPSKQSSRNAVALCGTCHTNYDHMYTPSFFFLPTDLSYFHNFEIEDRKRRRRLARHSEDHTIPARICPTAQTYQHHQLSQGIEGAEMGGLYTRIVLKDFLPTYIGRPAFTPGESEYGARKSWVGSPMAALHKAIGILGNLNLKGVPRDVREGLRQLQDVYSEEVVLTGEDTSSEGEDEESEQGHGQERKDSMPDQQEQEQNPPSGSAGSQSRDRDVSTQQRQYEKEPRGRTQSIRQAREQNDVVAPISEDQEIPKVIPGKQNDNAYPSPPPAQNSEESIRVETLSKVEAPEAPSKVEKVERISTSSTSSTSSSWRWGPRATSNDAVRFFRRVL
ncbi:hypothetical protein NHQ30_006450 [Ciborinia camelliae]|nr:hypothetical protein NHQ30_006450 [Ciborinia camelliae]